MPERPDETGKIPEPIFGTGAYEPASQSHSPRQTLKGSGGQRTRRTGTSITLVLLAIGFALAAVAVATCERKPGTQAAAPE